MRKKVNVFLSLLVLPFFMTANAFAEPVIVNGSFETGDYTGWKLEKEILGKQTWAILQGGQIVVPFDYIFDEMEKIELAQYSLCLARTYEASEGVNAAVQLTNTPGAMKMYQDVTLPDNATALVWEMSHKSMATFGNDQYLAVNIRQVTGELLEQIFITDPSFPQEGVIMESYPMDISAYAGQTVRIEVEINTRAQYFTVALDNFRVEVAEEVVTRKKKRLPPGWKMGKKRGWEGKEPPGWLKRKHAKKHEKEMKEKRERKIKKEKKEKREKRDKKERD